MRFGPGKGKTIEQLDNTDSGLVWYIGAFTRDVNNPEKALYRATNQRTLKALQDEHDKRTSTTASGASVDTETGEIFDRMVPPDEPDEQAERATLMKSIKELSVGTKISKEDREQAARTYLGEGGTLAKADIAGLAGLRDWLKARAGK
jgi:hypothetical protein